MTGRAVFRHAAATLAALALAGCVQAPKELYMWGNFPRHQYDSLAHEGASPEVQIQAMKTQMDKARAANAALPPGFRAHLGLLLLSSGDAAAAREMWMAEKLAFPESAAYIDSLLKRLDSKPPVATAKQSAA